MSISTLSKIITTAERVHAKIRRSMTGVGKMLKIVVSVMAIVLFMAPVVAVAATAISQGFTSDEPIQVGTIVSSKGKNQAITPAATDNDDRLLGIVSESSLVELSDESSEVQVVTSGIAEALVSDINGDIKTGDSIAASPIRGVGMKATESGYVVGVARADFSAAKDTIERTMKDNSGEEKTVKVGLIPVHINVIQYEKPDDKKSVVPQFILNIAQAVSGKEVSVVRVLAALLVLIVGTIAIGVMLYASVRSSISSIGRNPLAAAAVNRGLLEISLLTLGILVIMLAAVYLILTL